MKYLILSIFLTTVAVAAIVPRGDVGPRRGAPLTVTVTVDDAPLTVRLEGECSRLKAHRTANRYELDVCREANDLLSVQLSANQRVGMDPSDFVLGARVRPEKGATVVLGATHKTEVTMRVD